MKFLLFFAVAATACLALPRAIPGETHTRALHIASSRACGVKTALEGRASALPRFSRALAGDGVVRIVAIGSSSTEGIGASSPNAAYPAQLHALLQESLPRERFEVINLGIGGEIARQTVKRIRQDIPPLAPDLIVWQVGTNDALKGVPLKDYEATVRGALKFLKARRLDVILVGMQWTRRFGANPAYRAVRAATERIARRESVTLVSRYDAMRRLAQATGREDMIGPDRLHMNDRGYRCLAEEVAFALSHSVDDTVERPGRI